MGVRLTCWIVVNPQGFPHFNRSIEGEGGEVTFWFTLLLPAFPLSPPQRVL